MDIVIFAIIFIFGMIPGVLIIKFNQRGLSLSKSIGFICRFPKDIILLHISMYIEMKDKNKRKAIKLLFAPITQFANVLNLYVESCVLACAKIEAVKEVINEAESKKELVKLRAVLKSQGINLKIKKNKVKEVTIRKINKKKESLGNDEEFIRRLEQGAFQRALA